jgi:hypothetical protein
MCANVLHKTSKGMREMNYQDTQQFERDIMLNNPLKPLLVLCSVRRCSFFVIVRVFDKYFKTNVDAESVEDAEQIIEKAIIGFEYQIMNIYKTNE